MRVHDILLLFNIVTSINYTANNAYRYTLNLTRNALVQQNSSSCRLQFAQNNEHLYFVCLSECPLKQTGFWPVGLFEEDFF
jgi:hypothetical protein